MSEEEDINYIDESFRIDDNSCMSKIAQEEGNGMNDPLIPGLGVEIEGNELTE